MKIDFCPLGEAINNAWRAPEVLLLNEVIAYRFMFSCCMGKRLKVSLD